MPLSWPRANRAIALVGDWRAQFNAFRLTPNAATFLTWRPNTAVLNIAPGTAGTTSDVTWQPIGAAGPPTVSPFGLVITAMGFGEERSYVEYPPGHVPPLLPFRGYPFWSHDPFETPHAELDAGPGPAPRVDLSAGDGALQDFLRIVTRFKYARYLWDHLPLTTPQRLAVQKSGQDIEDQASRASPGRRAPTSTTSSSVASRRVINNWPVDLRHTRYTGEPGRGDPRYLLVALVRSPLRSYRSGLRPESAVDAATDPAPQPDDSRFHASARLPPRGRRLLASRRGGPEPRGVPLEVAPGDLLAPTHLLPDPAASASARGPPGPEGRVLRRAGPQTRDPASFPDLGPGLRGQPASDSPTPPLPSPELNPSGHVTARGLPRKEGTVSSIQRGPLGEAPPNRRLYVHVGELYDPICFWQFSYFFHETTCTLGRHRVLSEIMAKDGLRV